MKKIAAAQSTADLASTLYLPVSETVDLKVLKSRVEEAVASSLKHDEEQAKEQVVVIKEFGEAEVKTTWTFPSPKKHPPFVYGKHGPGWKKAPLTVSVKGTLKQETEKYLLVEIEGASTAWYMKSSLKDWVIGGDGKYNEVKLWMTKQYALKRGLLKVAVS